MIILLRHTHDRHPYRCFLCKLGGFLALLIFCSALLFLAACTVCPDEPTGCPPFPIASPYR